MLLARRGMRFWELKQSFWLLPWFFSIISARHSSNNLSRNAFLQDSGTSSSSSMGCSGLEKQPAWASANLEYLPELWNRWGRGRPWCIHFREWMDRGGGIHSLKEQPACLCVPCLCCRHRTVGMCCPRRGHSWGDKEDHCGWSPQVRGP